MQTIGGSKTFDKVILFLGLFVLFSFFRPFSPFPGIHDNLVHSLEVFRVDCAAEEAGNEKIKRAEAPTLPFILPLRRLDGFNVS